MAVQNSNFTALITAIDTKAQSLAASSTDPKDLVYLSKSLEALNVTATVSDVIAAGDTKVTAVNTAGSTQVGVVQAEGATQVAAVTAAGGSYATSATLNAMRSVVLVTIVGGKFAMDGTSQQALKLTPSVVYRFDQSDASNATHPLQFSTTSDGTHASGTAITAGVTVVGTAGSAGAYVEYVVEQDSVATYYYCGNHSGMGGTAYATSAASSGGTAAYDGTVELYNAGYNLQAQGNWLTVTNLDSYANAVRIRGLDNSTKAYAGINCMTRNGSATANMEHSFILMSANQTTGAVALENVIQTHNNTASSNDYSTVTKASDEWSGRYTYLGHVPRNNANHTYGYDQVLITSDNTQDSQHVNISSIYGAGNSATHSAWIDPSEHRLGGAVTHYLTAYNSSSKAIVAQYRYGYSSTTLNNISPTNNPGFTTSITSTNYPVALFNQFDVTNLPYYDAFHSVSEGLYAHNRAADSWANLGSNFGMQNGYIAFFLSNGNIILKDPSDNLSMITQAGTLSSLSSSFGHQSLGTIYYNDYEFCWNVGTDEWLQALPNARFCKFKINPSTGQFTQSNILSVSSLSDASYDDRFNQKRGLWSQMTPGTVSTSNAAFTFGTEHSSGVGYGRSKLFFVGGDQASKQIFAATYDIAGLVAALTYP